MDNLVAVAVGLMISTYMSLPANGANSRHKSPYSALRSVVNKAGTALYAHICMSIFFICVCRVCIGVF